MRAFRRVLYASDFSRASRAAFARAIDLAKLNRAELTIVHVLSRAVPYVGEGYALRQVYDQMLADVRSHAQKQLDRLRATAKASGVRAKGCFWRASPPTESSARPGPGARTLSSWEPTDTRGWSA
jgi:nucleotide-binding universal stress UspA family protein